MADEKEPIITFIEEYEKEEPEIDIFGDGQVKKDEQGNVKMQTVRYRKMNCSKHGDYEVPFYGMFTFDNCPMCGEEKQKKYEAEERERELAQKKARMNDVTVLRNMGIGSRYFKCRFENWIPEDKEPMKSLQEKAKAGVMKVTEEKKGTVLLMGGTGTRKTSLAVCSLIELGEGYITTMFECSFRLRAGDNGGTAIDTMTGYKFLKFLKTTKVLVIDEAGMTSCTDFDKQWIADVLNARDGDNLLTFVISNYPIKELAPPNYKGIVLDDVFGQTVMSRFNHAYKFRVSGTDFRTLEKVA